MKNCGISEVFIVISSDSGPAIEKILRDGSRYKMKIQYIVQPKLLGTAHALGILEEYIDSSLIVFLGDIYLVIDEICPLIEDVVSGKANAMLVSKLEKNPEMIKRNYSILEETPGRVRRVIEKPRSPVNQIKGCGVYIFDQHVFNAVSRTPRTAMRNEYEITDSIQIMIDDGFIVSHKSVVRYDLNLTFPHELLAVNLMELKRRKLKNIIGKNVQIPSGASIENSVIGDNTFIKNPIRIKNSLILPDAQVISKIDILNSIVQRNRSIQCKPVDWQ